MTEIKATPRGPARFFVYVNGEQDSAHASELEALEATKEILAGNPDADVSYLQEYVVDVELADDQTLPPVDPDVPPPEPEPTPPPAGGEDEPSWQEGDQVVFQSDAEDPYYEPDGDLTAAGHAGKAEMSRRFAPNSSPLINGYAVDDNEVAIEDGMIVMRYRQTPDQAHATWHVAGANEGWKGLPHTAEHYFSGEYLFEGSATQNYIKFARLLVVSMDGENWGGGAMPQWSTNYSAPYDQGNAPSDTPLWQVYGLAFTDEALPYPDGHDQGQQPHGPYMKDLFDGKRHRFTFGWKGHSEPGVLDGFQRMWIDGKKVLDVSAAAVNVTPEGGYKQWCGMEMVKKAIPTRALMSEGIALGGTQYQGNVPEWKLKVAIDGFLWWARVPATKGGKKGKGGGKK